MPNNDHRLIVPVSGMHCRSCELLLEEKMKQAKNVSSAKADSQKGFVEIGYDSECPDKDEVKKIIESAGYKAEDAQALPILSKNKTDYIHLAASLLLLTAVYAVLRFGGFSLPEVSTAGTVTLGFVFLIGLTAGVSTCMALVGGLVFGLSARYAETNPQSTAQQKLKPHLFFNLGRVFFFALFGGLLGAIGSVLSISGVGLSVLTIGVSLVMAFIGLKLINIFPRIESWSMPLPKGISRALGIGSEQREYSPKSAFLLAMPTFFLPCGFTQAVQLLAVGTGSFLWGALVMGVFAIGTAPGLFGIGGFASLFKTGKSGFFFRFAGLAVILFAVINISNSLAVFGIGLASADPEKTLAVVDPNVSVDGKVQIVRMKETNRGYSPDSFTISKDMPVRWVIDAQAPYSCASSLVVPDLEIEKQLAKGENVIEFTPHKAGRINFSCSMGMYRGYFVVQ